MTSDGDALFRAICDQPAEDTPRLVYADWLEENGQPERAEFIRLQCEAWNLCPAYPTLEAARTRAFLLAREFGDEWYSQLPWLGGVTWSGLFVRGFIDGVQVAADDIATTARLNAVFRAAPVRRIIINPLDQRRLPMILESPFLGRLAVLKLPWFIPDGYGSRFPYTVESYQLLTAAAQQWPSVGFNYPPPSTA